MQVAPRPHQPLAFQTQRRAASRGLAVASLSLSLVVATPSVSAFAATASTAPASVAPTTAPKPSAATTAATPVPPLAAPGKPAAQTLVAAATVKKISIFASPEAKKPVSTLDNKTNFSGRHVFVVLEHRPGWYKVLVPTRPNGRTGWVKAGEIGLFTTDYSIAISLSKRELTVFKAGKEVLRETVAIGQSKYPTPTGVFFIREGVRPSNPKGAYGTFAFGLSAYSNVLTRFGRGDGQVGIHGTNAPAKLGQAVSHGCIRMRNETVTKLSKMLPQGVPVVIEA
jgi:lipoprotein-anchoring transpeptidase ErfK/SrfK